MLNTKLDLLCTIIDWQDFSCLHVRTSNISQLSMMSGLLGDINSLCSARILTSQ